VTFEVVNVGEVPILVGLVTDAAGTAHRRHAEGLVLLRPGEDVAVSAHLVTTTIVVEVAFSELSGMKRSTRVELRRGSIGWVVARLRERK
jgi:hypothetical protein